MVILMSRMFDLYCQPVCGVDLKSHYSGTGSIHHTSLLVDLQKEAGDFQVFTCFWPGLVGQDSPCLRAEKIGPLTTTLEAVILPVVLVTAIPAWRLSEALDFS